MRQIGIPEIEDIALGAALLGAGGGGDPYVGKLVAIGTYTFFVTQRQVEDTALAGGGTAG